MLTVPVPLPRQPLQIVRAGTVEALGGWDQYGELLGF